MSIVVLISGTGSNLQSLIDAREGGTLDVDIRRVISNRPRAAGLSRAENAGIEAVGLDHREFDSREAFDAALVEAIEAARPELIVLAGFMRILTDSFVDRFPHDQPAPLPAAGIPGPAHL